MSRKKSSFFENLIEIASKLPWKVGIGLALVSYLGFHYLAAQQPPSFSAPDFKTYGQTIGNNVGKQLLITMSLFLQYIVPVAFLIGAGISFFRRRRQAQLHRSVANDPSRDTLESMSWQEFEGLTAEVFRRKGFEVTERGGNGADGGVDLELRVGKDKYLVQCKQWRSNKVGVATVRELFGVMTAEGAVGGFVVASGEFTEDAKRFAEGRAIELVSTERILSMIDATRDTGLQRPRGQTTPDCPTCGQRMVKRTAKRGADSGSMFWGCSRYPACRGVRQIG